MSKRGMTLIEIIAALAILSIASLTLFGGFSAVLEIMGNSSTMKNNGDMLLSYAEETMNNDVRDNTQIDTDKVTYTISSDCVSVPVARNIVILNVKDGDKVHLKALEEPGNQEKVRSTFVHKESKSNLDEFYKSIKKAREAHEEMENGDSYNVFLKNVHTLMSSNWIQFPKELLPVSYRLKLGVQDVYVFPYYPWEIKKGDLQYDHGDLVIMSDLRSELVDIDIDSDDYLYMTYDYDNEHWYYCDQDTYRIKTAFSSPDGEVLYDAKNNGYIRSQTDMKDIVKNPKNGWKILDIDAEYNTNMDSMWKNIS